MTPPARSLALAVLAAAGCTGHIIQILDPAEETLPYEGRTEFYGPSGRERWVADRAGYRCGRSRAR